MHIAWKCCRAAAGVLCLALAIGCASDKAASKADVSAEPLANQARRMRHSDSEGDRLGTGLSDKSRDVERDLGFR